MLMSSYYSTIRKFIEALKTEQSTMEKKYVRVAGHEAVKREQKYVNTIQRMKTIIQQS